jgi:hypothetical protein
LLSDSIIPGFQFLNDFESDGFDRGWRKIYSGKRKGIDATMKGEGNEQETE